MSEGFEIYESCQPHAHLTPTSGRLEAFKKVCTTQSCAIGAAKFYVVKIENEKKSGSCLVHMNTESLKSSNFVAP